MSKAERTKGPKLKSELTRAQALVQAGRLDEAAPLLHELAPQLRGSEGWRLLLSVLESLGREQEARQALHAAARDKPGDHSIGLRAALDLHGTNDFAGAVALFDRLPVQSREEPEIQARYAHALFMIGRRSDALGQSRGAYARKPRGVPALVHGMVALDAGDLVAAGQALERAAQSLEDPARAQAEGLLASALFWRGETARALELFKGLDARGALEGDLLTLFAVAAALHADEPLARTALARAPEPESPFARLAAARVELALGKPEAALAALESLAPGAELPELLAPLVAASRGRALRALGRTQEARQALEPLAEEAAGALGAMALTDLGRIDSDEGQHEQAASRFARALELDPSSQEAERGLALARERTAWRDQLAAKAEDQVSAARAEAEAMRRAFAQQERELAMLRSRLAQTEKAADQARAQADRAREEAERARHEALREELELREVEAAQRADEALAEAFGASRERCPASLWEALRVAETTYQKALYTELHPAAIAVLYAGALERGLYLLLVRPFELSLTPAAREALLSGAARELRPGRVEYSERFVEAFDPARHARAPALGEIARALARRRDPALRPFGEFLATTLGLDDALLDALAAFVERAKQELRDPVAHGRALELPQQELVRFRRELLFELPGVGRGAIPALVAGRK